MSAWGFWIQKDRVSPALQLTLEPGHFCRGPSWALWGVKHHPWSPPTWCQEHPPNVTTKNISRHHPASLGSRITPMRTTVLREALEFFEVRLLATQEMVLESHKWGLDLEFLKSILYHPGAGSRISWVGFLSVQKQGPKFFYIGCLLTHGQVPEFCELGSKIPWGGF